MITLQLFKSDLSFHLCSWKNTCIGSEVLLDWTSGIGKRGKLWWRTEWSLYLESSWDFYKTHTIIILTCNSNSETCLLLHHLCLKFTMCTCQSYGLVAGESVQLQCNLLVVTGHCWETEWFSFKAVLVKENFLTIWCSMNLWWGGGVVLKQNNPHTQEWRKMMKLSQGYSFKNRCTCNKRMFFVVYLKFNLVHREYYMLQIQS